MAAPFPSVVLEPSGGCKGAVGRAVVDDHHLADAGLEQYAIEDPLEGAFLVKRGDDDAQRLSSAELWSGRLGHTT